MNMHFVYIFIIMLVILFIYYYGTIEYFKKLNPINSQLEMCKYVSCNLCNSKDKECNQCCDKN